MKLATLCYLRVDGQTLMLHRGKKLGDIHAGKWNGLGGKLDPGEDPDRGVIREVAEECGLLIERPRLAGVLTFPQFKDREDWYVFVYTASSFTGELRDCDEGELTWIPDDELLDLSLWEGDRTFLPFVLSGQFFSGSFVYKEKKLVAKHGVVYEGGLGRIVSCFE